MPGESSLPKLREAAERARQLHYAPYSNYLVLAAVETRDGLIFGGANLEIANYSLTKHAEEVAILAALHAGGQDPRQPWLRRLYVAGGAPCGSCRQFAWEFAEPDSTCLHEPVDQTWLRSNNLNDLGPSVAVELSFAALLPDAFGPRDLGVR